MGNTPRQNQDCVRVRFFIFLWFISTALPHSGLLAAHQTVPEKKPLLGRVMVRILVTGCNGLLGNRLIEFLRARTDVELIATSLGPNRHIQLEGYHYVPMDVMSEHQVLEVCGRYRPDAIIHTAALTQVDMAEQQPLRCRRLNVGAVANMVGVCARFGIHLVHLSTDFVFDGLSGPYSETDPVSPISVYGRSKAAAELLLKDSEISWAVVRTILVYGHEVPAGRSNIVSWAVKLLQSGDEVRVVNDQIRMPTFVGDLAQACVEIAMKRERGIFHISGQDEVSIVELVGRVAQHLGLSMEKVQPVSSSDLPGAELRPRRTGFLLDKARSKINYYPIPLDQGLTAVLGPHVH